MFFKLVASSSREQRWDWHWAAWSVGGECRVENQKIIRRIESDVQREEEPRKIRD